MESQHASELLPVRWRMNIDCIAQQTKVNQNFTKERNKHTRNNYVRPSVLCSAVHVFSLACGAHNKKKYVAFGLFRCFDGLLLASADGRTNNE